MKKILLMGFLSLWGILTLSAQKTDYKVTFGYDNAGNRISRNIIELKKKAPKEGEDKLAKISDLEVLSFSFDKSTVKVYPNPNGGKFQVELIEVDESAEVVMEITNLKGQSLIQKKSNNRKEAFDITDQDNGVYILSIWINDTKQTWKIIKK